MALRLITAALLLTSHVAVGQFGGLFGQRGKQFNVNKSMESHVRRFLKATMKV